jgi:hypothetical protein
MRCDRKAIAATGVCLLAWSLCVSAEQPGGVRAPAFPREGARKVLENDNVVIWDVTWRRGTPTALLERRYDQVTVTLAPGAVKVTRPDESWTVQASRVGDVQYESRGTVASEEGVSDRPRRAMVFEIKSYSPPPVSPEIVKLLEEKKKEGVPGQFDAAAGGLKLFENDRIVLWQKTWNPRGALHAHYSWIAGVWIQPGVQGQVSGTTVLPPCSLEKAARAADGWPISARSTDECQASDETLARFRAGTGISEVGATRWGPPGVVHQEEGLGFPGYSPAAPQAIFIEFKEIRTAPASSR